MPEVDHASVNRYWESVKSSILGPYMMDGFGFPVSAGDFRFRAEARIVQQLLRGIEHNGSVLDLGSGVGYWAVEFASSFSRVDAIEGSNTFYQALKERCAPHPNIRAIHGDVLSFQQDGHHSLIFLGGLLMYLDEHDVITLLKKLVPCLRPGGIILCRESTVRGETETRTGDYSVVYRSVSDYTRIFNQCGLTLKHVERNEPYVLLQMGCDLIKKWKQTVPKPFQALPIVGALTYWCLRIGAPLMKRLPKILGIPFPGLENHFFLLGTRPIK
ncbi:MAG: class I SAM-dependent methyltransferase [Nitrospirota bacterium]|nr:class I SAM-dependent methyltransferase [Nitrospirota bacterium]